MRPTPGWHCHTPVQAGAWSLLCTEVSIEHADGRTGVPGPDLHESTTPCTTCTCRARRWCRPARAAPRARLASTPTVALGDAREAPRDSPQRRPAGDDSEPQRRSPGQAVTEPAPAACQVCASNVLNRPKMLMPASAKGGDAGDDADGAVVERGRRRRTPGTGRLVAKGPGQVASRTRPTAELAGRPDEPTRSSPTASRASVTEGSKRCIQISLGWTVIARVLSSPSP